MRPRPIGSSSPPVVPRVDMGAVAALRTQLPQPAAAPAEAHSSDGRNSDGGQRDLVSASPTRADRNARRCPRLPAVSRVASSRCRTPPESFFQLMTRRHERASTVRTSNWASRSAATSLAPRQEVDLSAPRPALTVATLRIG